MATLSVQTSAADYDTWKSVFEANEGLRRGHGATGHRVLSSGNDALVLVDFPDESSAKAMQSDPDLRAAFQKAGLQSTPNMRIWTESEQAQY